MNFNTCSIFIIIIIYILQKYNSSSNTNTNTETNTITPYGLTTAGADCDRDCVTLFKIASLCFM